MHFEEPVCHGELLLSGVRSDGLLGWHYFFPAIQKSIVPGALLQTVLLKVFAHVTAEKSTQTSSLGNQV
jgi:hypothetical protein